MSALLVFCEGHAFFAEDPSALGTHILSPKIELKGMIGVDSNTILTKACYVPFSMSNLAFHNNFNKKIACRLALGFAQHVDCDRRNCYDFVIIRYFRIRQES